MALGGNRTQRSRRNGAAGERKVIEGNGPGPGMRGHQRIQPAIMLEEERGAGKLTQIAALHGRAEITQRLGELVAIFVAEPGKR